MEEVLWTIKHDPNDAISLHISGNGQTFHCPAELFGEVTLFLQGKGILKSNILTRTASIPGIIRASSLPIPKVEGNIDIECPSAPVDALASFDITSEVEPVVAPTSTPASTSIDINGSKVESEIIKRPVIRTKFSDEDPMSAEKEAAAIREKGVKDTKKIKRK